MVDEVNQQEVVILVQVELPHSSPQLSEFCQLAEAAGAQVAEALSVKRYKPDVRYFVGQGKVEELQLLVAACQAELVLFNHELTPKQISNLERLLKCRVVDRTGLILDIFAMRARTFEGKLQVELAQLSYQATRLVRGWTHLERQKGGIGLRGPGETQLETDRRLLRERVKLLKKRLEKVRKQRQQGRRARQRRAVPTVALVGYTNAGKSSLFNKLSAAEVYVKDQLFATLDPTLRKLNLQGFGTIILADTVGFVRDLPHQLIDAFRATLEEVVEADLLIHVVDAADPEHIDHIERVQEVLNEIEATNLPTVFVYNKIDLLEDKQVRCDYLGQEPRVWLSAATGAGLVELQQVVVELLAARGYTRCCLNLSVAEGRLHALLHQRHAVLQEEVLADGGWRVEVCLAPDLLQILTGS